MFPKEGTRLLVVDGQGFRWHFSPKHVESDATGTLQAQAGGVVVHYTPRNESPAPGEAAELIRFAIGGGIAKTAGAVWVEYGQGGWRVRVPSPVS